MTTARDADDYLSKAQESLASAEADVDAGRYNSCANRCYYACFQAALAALVRAGAVSSQAKHEHDFVHSAFALLIIRRRLYPVSLRSSLPRLLATRQEADYRTTMVSNAGARRCISSAREFVTTVTSRVT